MPRGCAAIAAAPRSEDPGILSEQIDCLGGRETGWHEVSNATVESSKPSIMTQCDAQEMSIGHLAVPLELFGGYEPRSHQGNVVRKEDVMRESEDPTES